MVDIKEIKVYDPKQDGLDFQTYERAFLAVEQVSPRAADLLLDGLHNRILKSKVDGQKTLREFLFGKDGYFSGKETFAAVMFLDGRFKEEYNIPTYPNLDTIANETNSIPLMFFHDPEGEHYLKLREAMTRITGVPHP